MSQTQPVIIYGAEWCAFCHVAMDYLDKKGVKYEYIDVDTDINLAKKAMEVSGQTGIPVLDFGDGKIVIGFDRPRIDAALAA